MVLRPTIRLRHVHAGGTRRPEAPVIPEGHPRMARSALLNVMVQAAFKAGKSLSRDFGEVQNLQVSLKGPGDYVSQADRKAEKLIREELMKARPTYGFLGEESEEIIGTDG